MKSKILIIIFFILSIVLSSCKDDKHNDVLKNQTENNFDEDNEGVKKPLLNNIYEKVSATPELSLLEKILDSLNLKDTLIFDEGPFTILAVKDEVFHSFLKTDSLFSAISENNQEWKTIMNTYIINDQLSSVDIFQKIKKNGGEYQVKTRSGSFVKFYLIENDIVVEGPKGLISIIGKSDIMGTNGVLHIIDNLIGIY